MTIIHRVAAIVLQYPDRPALEIDSTQWSYRELWRAAGEIARVIESREGTRRTPVAIFASRSFVTYVGILGILRSGRPYLPINLKFPVSRTSRMLDLAQSGTAIVSEEFEEYVRKMLDDHATQLSLIDVEILAPLCEEAGAGDEASDSMERSMLFEEHSTEAYFLFTSGTTGEPKGIPVTHANLEAYIEFIRGEYDLGPDDRISQAFDTTFDPSVHDMFVCWSAGACLCPLSPNDLLLPNRFINRKKLTVWSSVPSIALRMKQVRMLKPNSLPTLRYTLFTGEGLPDHVAESWSQAAPNSVIVNGYGPTEITINISRHEWKASSSPALAVNGIVPIGKIFSTHRFRIVDEHLHPLKWGARGELLVSGPQVTNGYLKDADRTKHSFVKIEGEVGIWYRTGDLVNELEDGTLQYLGRIDHQVQIRGYRVEIAEVESFLRSMDAVTETVVLPLQDSTGMVHGLHAFLLSSAGTTLQGEALHLCREHLPEYMVPTRFTVLAQFPITPSGKIDRKQLLVMEK